MPPSPPDVPEIDYVDWKQMIDVVYKTKARFVDAMEAAVMTDAAVYGALRANTAPATTLHSFRDPIYHDAAICYFEGQARQIVAHLTLDKPSPWTRFVADSLFKRVMRVSRIYRDVIVYHHAYEFTHDDNTLPMTQFVNEFGNPWPHLFEFKAQHMCDLMKQEVDLAFGGQCPWNRHSFDQSFVADLLTCNFHVLDLPPYFVLSTRELHATRLAFAQGTHARLGDKSEMQRLDSDLCALIYSFVCLAGDQTQAHFYTAAQWLY